MYDYALLGGQSVLLARKQQKKNGYPKEELETNSSKL